MHSPSQEVFDSLLKDELITLGKHLDLEVKKSMKEDQIQEIIFNISVLKSRFMPDVELKKLELQLELKKLEMQKEQELRERELQ